MIKKEFFDTYQGQEIYKYTIVGGITVSVVTLGARITNIFVPDKNGSLVDVALSMTSAEDIVEKGDYMGATIGRCANRMGGDGFALNGKTYSIWRNGSAAHLHGGKFGFDKKIFSVLDEGENFVKMGYVSPDGEEGYPGKLDMTVKFTVDGADLIIEYDAVSDKDTLFNPTNHTYFNLNGDSDGSILDNVLKLNADAYLPTDELFVPTGEVKPVSGTPFDFNDFKPIGRDIFAPDKDLTTAGGYDHNFCLTDRHFATVYSTKTGIKMDCYTDLPGVQFYDGNLLIGQVGKSKYGKRSGFCLETQYYPDAVHHKEWQRPVLKADENFYSKTVYSFSTID